MIQKLLISNDKSIVKLLPQNSEKWFSGAYDNIIRRNQFTFILNKFCDYMEDKVKKVSVISPKYKANFFYPYHVVTHMFQPPFSIVVVFNYIEYLNKCGFNYIIKSSTYEDLKPFVKDILDEYLDHLEEFCIVLKDKIENKDPEMLKAKLSHGDRLSFIKHLFTEYIISKRTVLVNLSVTADFHFEDAYSKNLFFNTVKDLVPVGYKPMTVYDETVFFYPSNFNIRKPVKLKVKDVNSKKSKKKNVFFNDSLPKIRFYDKQKDAIYRYYLKLYKGNHFFFLKSYDDITNTEKFEAIDIYSQDRDTLEWDFINALTSLDNTIRFEIEFSQAAAKKKFKSVDFFKLKLDNTQLIREYLVDLLDMESTFLKENIFRDCIRPKTKKTSSYLDIYTYFKKVNINLFSLSGDIRDKFEFVVKEAEFLNRLTSSVRLHSKHLNVCSAAFDPNTGLSQNAIYSKIKRLRGQGVVRGKGKNIILNQPYKSLLHIYNYYHVHTLLVNLDKMEPRAKA